MQLSRANDVCRAAKRSTLSAQDVLRALECVGLPEFATAASTALDGFKGSAAGKARASKAAGAKREGGAGGGRQASPKRLRASSPSTR